MGRHQSVQYGSVDRQRLAKNSPAESANPQAILQLKLSLLTQLLQHCPVIFWGAVLTVPLLITGLAVTILMDPSYVARQSDPTATVADQSASPQAAAQQDKELPLWSLGAIVLSCAAGTVMISRRFNKSEPERPQSNRSQRLQKPQKLAAKGNVSPPRPIQRPQLVAATQPVRAVLPPNLRSTPPALKAARSTAARPIANEPIITVVPAEESHPLDWDEKNLADAMDIRKRRPLSSWL